MALFVYMIADGRLYSYSGLPETPIPDEAATADLLARGMAWKTIDQVLDITHQWDPETLSVIEVPPPYEPRDIPCSRLVLAFTAQELASVRASQDPVVQQLMLAVEVSPEIDMNRQSTIDGINYLALIGLITSERAATILQTE